MGKTPIEWTEESWNPIGGCQKVSPGCKNCYAIRVARRLGGSPIVKIGKRYEGLTVAGPNWSGKTFIDDEVLLEPLTRRIPTTYFISLSDLFYDERSDRDIDRVFAAMALAKQHKFLILTKYHERMLAYFACAPDLLIARWGYHAVELADSPCAEGAVEAAGWPFSNVGLGVSVEDQQRADERMIPVLLQTPAAMRFVSAEPLLGAVELTSIRIREDRSTCRERYDVLRGKDRREHLRVDGTWNHRRVDDPNGDPCWTGNCLPKLDWVIVGGESGAGVRPCDIAWIRSIKDQCQAAGVPVFVKQLGARPHEDKGEGFFPAAPRQTPRISYLHLKDRKGGDMDEWPEDLRVRELPEFLRRPA